MFARVFGGAFWMGVVGAGFLFAWGGSGPSQTQLGNESLKKDFEAPGAFKSRQDLIKGETQPGKNDDKLIDVMAKWYVYRVTWTLQRDNSSEMAKVHEALESELVKPLLNPNAK